MAPVPGAGRVSASAFGVTGTDTGVGKTIIAAALAAALRQRGARVGVFKPVETGVAAGTDPPDAALLREAAGAPHPIATVCPATFAEPLAPMIAAERAGIRIDLDALEIRNDDKTTHLTLMEADLLRYLLDHPGKIIARKELLENVWHVKEDTDTRAIDNFIVRLRRYLEPDPAKPVHLLSVRGVGYRFIPDPGHPRDLTP